MHEKTVAYYEHKRDTVNREEKHRENRDGIHKELSILISQILKEDDIVGEDT